MHILLEESDAESAGELAVGLRRQGHGVDHVSTGQAALGAYRSADLVILDLDPPDLNGLALCREIRAAGDTPMIAITGRRTEQGRVLALRAGSDDCMEKPLGFRELLARIEAVMRRARRRAGRRERIDCGPLRIDRARREVSVADRAVELTVKEFDLLQLLASQPGSVVFRQEIMARVWGDTWNSRSRTVDTHVSSLRRKLGPDSWITTVRGVGLRFDRAPTEPAPGRTGRTGRTDVIGFGR